MILLNVLECLSLLYPGVYGAITLLIEDLTQIRHELDQTAAHILFKNDTFEHDYDRISYSYSISTRYPILFLWKHISRTKHQAEQYRFIFGLILC